MIQTPEQMEFSALIAALDLQPAAARMQRKPRGAMAVAAASPEDFAVVLLRAVTEENLTFSCYAVMMAVARRRETASLAGIAIECGYSYHATRHIVLRTHYLQKIDETPVRLALTADGTEKLARVSKRLARYV
jgi:hypothetical protein